MMAVHGIPLVLQLVVPLALLAWQWRTSHSIAHWLMKTAITAGCLVAVCLTGVWTVAPWYTGPVMLAALTVTAGWQVRTVRKRPWRRPQPRLAASVGPAVLVLLTIVALSLAVVARRPPSETIVDLMFPLRDGVYYVAAGGTTALLNPHLKTLSASRFEAFRGQSYGVDIVKLGPFGLRASGLLPRDPSRYAVFGVPVFAPCEGRVVHADDGAPDMPPPHPDRSRMAGNHVLLECDGVHVLLGHLRQGSVRVAPSAHVTTRTVVGLVGNSGNSNEPHLHVHAQRPAAFGAAPLSGNPLPMRFDGRYLVRNDRVTARSSATR